MPTRCSVAFEWLTTHKSSFQTDLLALPAKEMKQVMEKIRLLALDPTPAAHTKKLLKYIGRHRLCRLRSGDYRIFYTYESPFVSLLRLDRRDVHTYDDEIEPEFLGGPEGIDEIDLTSITAATAMPSAEATPAVPEPRAETNAEAPATVCSPAMPVSLALPAPISVSLLRALRIPGAYHARLLAVTNDEELLSCEGVPDEHLLRLDEYLFRRPIEHVLQQPDYLSSPDDLERFKDGDLLAFLLVLSPEQEKYTTWALNATGPTLVKGGPGTGKSTIALYRVRAMLESLRKAGVSSPRMLFTTYTKALVSYSEQLLQSLLGEDAACVTVTNVDKLARRFAHLGRPGWNVASKPELHAALASALEAVRSPSNPAEQAASEEISRRLSPDYLIDEFDDVIEARQISNCDSYLVAARTGRMVRLSAGQRRAVWHIYAAFTQALERHKLMTWGSMHRHAARAAGIANAREQYDAVVVDEAQDLDPNCIRLLVSLCRSPNRLFLTADANQSIYGSSFRWQDVHDSLRFRGRTGTLNTNFRTTRQIGEAAAAYLKDGSLDDEPVAQDYRTDGHMPVLRLVETVQEETDALVQFLQKSRVEIRLGVGSCAVLVPSAAAAQALAQRLQAHGIQAMSMPGDQLDLKKQCVKVITLQSAKGLEFPIVAVAGFLDGQYPHISAGASEDEVLEHMARERRVLYVAMTRAMRALLVVVPGAGASPLLQSFDWTLWEL
jgi:superfamily I DNA/RNA helicase/mRNA-degrading endonuclease RelE of RelBE toxin-antitoxin system